MFATRGDRYVVIISQRQGKSSKEAKNCQLEQSSVVSLSLAKFFKFVVCNPCRSSPPLTILVTLWFIIISYMFFYLYKVLFSGFLQFKDNFVDAQHNSKYSD